MFAFAISLQSSAKHGIIFKQVELVMLSEVNAQTSYS